MYEHDQTKNLAQLLPLRHGALAWLGYLVLLFVFPSEFVPTVDGAVTPVLPMRRGGSSAQIVLDTSINAAGATSLVDLKIFCDAMLLRRGILCEVVASGKLRDGRVLMADDGDDDGDDDDDDDDDSDNDSPPDSALIEQTGNLPPATLPSAIVKGYIQNSYRSTSSPTSRARSRILDL